LKAKVYDRVKTLVTVVDLPNDRIIPAGSIGVVIEAYESAEAEGYAVDFAFPDSSLVGDFAYANAYLEPNEFEVANECVNTDSSETAKIAEWEENKV
jgi:hypothetical protein